MLRLKINDTGEVAKLTDDLTSKHRNHWLSLYVAKDPNERNPNIVAEIKFF